MYVFERTVDTIIAICCGSISSMYVCVGLVGEAAVQVSQVRRGSSGRRDECANRCESALEIARGRCLVQP